ncbi:hypothetical protein BDB01DRAFT_901133 [Pilobolus umbonatus]|nr:hypothetical protein BDB01DRAFT_901133 [Pilobolus umbonatus]
MSRFWTKKYRDVRVPPAYLLGPTVPMTGHMFQVIRLSENRVNKVIKITINNKNGYVLMDGNIMIYISYPLHLCTPKIIADYPKQMITQTNTNMSGVTTEEPGSRKFTQKKYNTDTIKINCGFLV